ncbi:hypothetical protein TSUD_323310 [Trifolium subterraneum]|uniref:Uncharacterized protein n=1 Tax=Trifolium subterraneum TaxID=3900 RepID=A0A2Z6MSM6_TRISU|nr:hypothetical protein TSUD_323310 [Trifolium subterraneum]
MVQSESKFMVNTIGDCMRNIVESPLKEALPVTKIFSFPNEDSAISDSEHGDAISDDVVINQVVPLTASIQTCLSYVRQNVSTQSLPPKPSDCAVSNPLLPLKPPNMNLLMLPPPLKSPDCVSILISPSPPTSDTTAKTVGIWIDLNFLATDEKSVFPYNDTSSFSGVYPYLHMCYYHHGDICYSHHASNLGNDIIVDGFEIGIWAESDSFVDDILTKKITTWGQGTFDCSQSSNVSSLSVDWD